MIRRPKNSRPLWGRRMHRGPVPRFRPCPPLAPHEQHLLLPWLKPEFRKPREAELASKGLLPKGWPGIDVVMLAREREELSVGKTLSTLVLTRAWEPPRLPKGPPPLDILKLLKSL